MGYTKISKALNIPRNTIKSIIQKWKEYVTTINLPRKGHPPRLPNQAKRAVIREARKRAKGTLKELGSSRAESGGSDHRTHLQPYSPQSRARKKATA